MTAAVWITGRCWLWCGRSDLPVTWVGSVQSNGHEVPMYSCGACLDHLDAMVWAEIVRMDAPRPRQHTRF